MLFGPETELRSLGGGSFLLRVHFGCRTRDFYFIRIDFLPIELIIIKYNTIYSHLYKKITRCPGPVFQSMLKFDGPATFRKTIPSSFAEIGRKIVADR